MAEPADEISEQEKQTRNEMLFTLSERDRGTLAIAVTPNEWEKKEIYRELIFNQPYIILLWISEGFDKELQKKAPDLMHWMSKRFVFEENGPDGMEAAEATIEYGTMSKRGKIPERLERIRQLEETWEKLCYHNEDKKRLIKDKINLLRLLGKEYAAAFMYAKAEEAFLKAIALDHKVGAGLEGQLLYETGGFYYGFKKYELSLHYFLKALEVEKNRENSDIRNIYYMIGMVYQGLHQWDDALTNYVAALEAYKATNDGYSLGGTFHQLGMLYQDQGKWVEALENFRLALEWDQKTGNEYRMGRHFQLIGIIYEQQQNWDKALENYEQALVWKQRSGNDYELGHTYYPIASVYTKRGEYSQSLDFLTRAYNNFLLYDHSHLPLAETALARIREKLAEAEHPNPDTNS